MRGKDGNEAYPEGRDCSASAGSDMPEEGPGMPGKLIFRRANISFL